MTEPHTLGSITSALNDMLIALIKGIEGAGDTHTESLPDGGCVVYAPMHIGSPEKVIKATFDAEGYLIERVVVYE